MKAKKSLVVIAAVAIVSIAGVLLHATSPVGQLAAFLSSGVTNEEIFQRARVPLPSGSVEIAGAADNDDSWNAKLNTTGPTEFDMLTVTLLPGGTTGWHSHPGILLTNVIVGSIEWYDAQCVKHVYNAGDSLTENTQPHYVRNVGSVNTQFMITFVIAKGQPRRIDQPAPACAAALGLN